MSESDRIKKDEDDNIFIVKVTGNTSKTITIPDTVCEFCDIDFGDLIKLVIKDIKSGKQKQRK